VEFRPGVEDVRHVAIAQQADDVVDLRRAAALGAHREVFLEFHGMVYRSI